MLTLNDGRTELWQWDTGRKLTVDAECSQVHFSNKIFGRSIDVDVVDGVAIIPDILLQIDKDLMAWAFVGSAENGYTKISKVFKVNKRNKPADYVFTPTDQTTLGEILERLEEVENRPVGDITKEDIQDAVDNYLENNPVQVEETDPTVPDWAKQDAKPEYTADEVGAISIDTLQDAVDDALEQAKESGEFKGDPGAGVAIDYDAERKAIKIRNISGSGGGGNQAQPPLLGSTEEVTPMQVLNALLDGRDVIINYTQEAFGVLGFTSFILATEANMVVSSGVFALGDDLAACQLLGYLDADTWEFAIADLLKRVDIPETLPNPNALTFEGAASGSYDGSSPVTITIPTIAGEPGKDGKTPVRGIDYWTEADQESIIQQVIAALGTPVFGRVEEDKTIVLSGDLADGTYTFVFEGADGSKSVIGVKEIGQTAYINQIPISTDSSGNVYGEDYNGDGLSDGYKVGVRVSSGVDQPADGVSTTGYIPVNEGDVVYLKNITMQQNGTNYNCRISLFDSLTSTDQKNIQASNAADWVWDENGNAVQFTVPSGWFSGSKAKYMRLGASYIGPDSIVSVNQPII